MRRAAQLMVVLLLAGCGALPADTGSVASAPRTATPPMLTPSALGCTGTAPVPRKDMAFVYMSNRQEAVLFGGSDAANKALGDTWILKRGCWALQSPAQSPPERDFMAAAYDFAHGVVLLYGGRGGGQFYSDSWTWNGETWTQVAASGPACMFGGPVADFDPVAQRVLLFGMVGGGLPETWLWDGSKWQRQSPVHSPDGRATPSMALDPLRGQVLLFGGFSPGHGASSDTWTWNGTDREQLAPATRPPPRLRAAMACRTVRHVTSLWCGVAARL